MEKEHELQFPTEIPEGLEMTGPEGLTEEEARKRMEAGKGNTLKQTAGKTNWEIIRDNVLNLFNLLNFGLAVALILVGSYRNLLFMMVVFWNSAIGIYQEIKARNTINELNLLNAPKVHVIRDGEEKVMTPEETVQGDVVVFASGDQVIADAVVLEGEGRAMESLLTGESDAIQKSRDSWLYSGSYITEGKLKAQLVYVGEESYIGRLTEEAKKTKKTESGLISEMRKLIRWDSMILVPLGILLFLKQYFLLHNGLETAVPSSVAAMLGMIPEGLILLTTVTMEVGVISLARKKVLVQELYGIETLARVDILCLDKTGTITSGRIKMKSMEAEDCSWEEARGALSRFLGAMDERSNTLDAIRAAVESGNEKPVAILPFSSERKKSAASFADGKTYILGAPSFVLGDKYTDEMRERIGHSAERGLRVVLLAEADGIIEEEKLPEITRILAIISMSDEIRPHADETIRYFHEQGVNLKVISGDDPRTVAEIARQAGIENADMAVDATTLKTEKDIQEACEKHSIFGRVTPGQKKMLVEALQRQGHSVAMTGDGVNDIPALKTADCSIVMAEGADAAKHSAQLTLLSNDFGIMPDIVLEGRRIINNIARTATLFLTKTIFSMLLSVSFLFIPALYPFEPIHMSMISSVTVGIPGFFLALEPSRERIRGNFLRNVITRALPGGLAVAAAATAAMLLYYPSETCSTIATWICGLISLLVLFRTCLPASGNPQKTGLNGYVTDFIGRLKKMSLLRRIVVAGSGIALILVGIFFGGIFKMNRLHGNEIISLILTACIGIVVMLGAVIVSGTMENKNGK